MKTDRRVYPRKLFFVAIILASSGLAVEAAGKPNTLTVLATRDGGNVSWRPEGAFLLQQCADWFARERAGGEPVVAVDILGIRGESYADLRERLRIVSAMGYDAVMPSEYPSSPEQPLDPDALVAAYRGFPLQVVSANLRDARGNLLFPPYTIVNRGGARIGISAVSDSVEFRFRQEWRRPPHFGFMVSDPIRALDPVLEALRGRVDAVVVLIGYLRPEARRALLDLPGIDVIVAPSNDEPDTLRVSSVLEVGGRQGLGRMGLVLGPRRGLVKPTIGYVRLDAAPVNGPVSELLKQFEETRKTRSWIKSRAYHHSGMQGPYVIGSLGSFQGTRSYVYPNHSPAPRTGEGVVGKRIEGSIRGDQGGRLDFEWSYSFLDTLPRSPHALRWRRPHALNMKPGGGSLGPDWANPRPWHEVDLGSDEEKAIIALFRSVADRHLDWAEQESLAASLDVTRPETELRRRLEAYPVMQARAARLLGLAGFLERQAESGLTNVPRYWHRRGVVYLQLDCAADGTVNAPRVIENNAWPDAADSLAALAASWRMPPPESGGRAGGFTVSAEVALCRGDTRIRLNESAVIGGEPRAAFADGSHAAWLAALTSVDPAISLDEFLDEGPFELRVRGTAPDEIAKGLRSKKQKGALVPGPGSWWLDPLADLQVEGNAQVKRKPSNVLRWLAAPGLKEGWDWGGLTDRFDVARWIDEERFVVAGWSAVDHPRPASGAWLTFEVPTIWDIDLDQGTVRRFQGPPVKPGSEVKAKDATAKVREEAYPALTWVD